MHESEKINKYHLESFGQLADEQNEFRRNVSYIDHIHIIFSVHDREYRKGDPFSHLIDFKKAFDLQSMLNTVYCQCSKW